MPEYEIGLSHGRLSLNKLTFARGALMPFVGALDAIFRLIAAWKLFNHLENTTWHKPTNCRVDGNDISNLEFVRRIGFLAFSGDNRSDCYTTRTLPPSPYRHLRSAGRRA